MKVMIIGDWSRTTFEEIGTKFASGEDVQPEGAEILARWHDPSSRLVWIVVETPNSLTVQQWLTKWSEYMDWQTFTVLDDEEVGEVIQEGLPS